jgi:hypothetical protein
MTKEGHVAIWAAIGEQGCATEEMRKDISSSVMAINIK